MKNLEQLDMKTKRIIAFIIDACLSSIIFLGIPDILRNYFFAPFLLFCTYYIFLEFFFGRTLGKLIMNIKVVTTDGSPLTLKQSVLRHLGRLKKIFLFKKELFYHDNYSKTMTIIKSV